ncbi:MAG: TIGR02253 family HAD-type hydrolase [Candidatus Neomarinimicrobiota bacterium]
MIKAVIFDLDNTLLDFKKMKEFGVRAAIRAMIEAGLECDEDEAYEYIFKIYHDKGWEYQLIFDDFLKNKNGTINNKLLAAAIVAYRRAKEAALLVYPNVRRTLLRLIKNGIKIAVVSDAPSREAWMRIYYLNLHHVFDIVLTFDDTKLHKPSPIPFNMALDQLNVDPSEAIMVGDWPERDVVGASQVGIKTIFARYGDTTDIKNSGADWEVDDIYEVVHIVDGLNNV